MLMIVWECMSLETIIHVSKVMADKLKGIGTDTEETLAVTFDVEFAVFVLLDFSTQTPDLLSIYGGHCTRQKRPYAEKPVEHWMQSVELQVLQFWGQVEQV